MINQPPTLRIEIESVKYQVLRALSDHQTEIEKRVASALDQIDISKLLEVQVNHYVGSLVKECIEKAVATAVKDAIQTQDNWNVLTLYVENYVHSLLQKQVSK